MSGGQKQFLLCLSWVAIFIVSLLLNLSNRDFPLGYHFDEIKKVDFILTGDQDFHHPLLMLEMVRWVNAGQGLTDPQAVVELGRTLMAVVGACVPVVMIWFAVPALGRGGAWVLGALVAVTPTLVLHSHYLKEDMLLVLLSMLALTGFARFLETRQEGWLIGAALLWGLAMGSHYKGLLVGVVCLPFLLVSAQGSWRLRGATVLLVLVLAVLGFLLPNAAIIDQWETFLSGFQHERDHALQGHMVPIYATDFYFAYHLRFSLLPGMTYGLGTVAVISLLGWTIHWARLRRSEQMLLVFVWVSYLVPEISPLKPNPDEARYILPAIPGLLYFVVKSAQAIGATRGGRSVGTAEDHEFEAAKLIAARSVQAEGPSASPRIFTQPWRMRMGWSQVAVAAAVLLLGWAALWDTLQLNHYLVRDTRAALVRWEKETGARVVGEPMTGTDNSRMYAADQDMDLLRQQGYTHYALSSFAFDPYWVTAHLRHQSPGIEHKRGIYESLLRQETVRFEAEYRSFGFSNPRLIVIPLQKTTTPQPVKK